MTKPELPEHFAEVLKYLVDRTAEDPDAYCWAVGQRGLYHVEFGVRGLIRTPGTFLYTTLKAMENRGLVVRKMMTEGMVAGPATRYTVARITDKGRDAWERARPFLSAEELATMSAPSTYNRAIELSDRAEALSSSQVKRLFVENTGGRGEGARWSVTAYGLPQMLSTSQADAFFSAHVSALQLANARPCDVETTSRLTLSRDSNGNWQADVVPLSGSPATDRWDVRCAGSDSADGKFAAEVEIARRGLTMAFGWVTVPSARPDTREFVAFLVKAK